MTMPLVSVIIPCFDSGAFVADAVKSALGQEWPRIEVIVVDDGSTDHTCEVLESFGKSIRWVTGPNRGACKARNRGLSMARGDYIQFLDADDMLCKEKISSSIKVIESTKRSLVYSWHEVISLGPSRSRPFQWNRIKGNEDPVAFMLAGDLPTPAPLHRHSVLDVVGGFREDLMCAQDREFHLRLALAGVKFMKLSQVLIRIRRWPGSLGSSNPEAVQSQRGKIAWETYLQLKDSGRLTETYRKGCAEMLAKASRGLVRKRPLEARMLMRKAFEVHEGGGLEAVYSKSGRFALRLVGPRMTEELAIGVSKIRRLKNRALDRYGNTKS